MLLLFYSLCHRLFIIGISWMNMLRVAYYFCCDVSDVCKCACGLGRVNILCIKAECNLYIVSVRILSVLLCGFAFASALNNRFLSIDYYYTVASYSPQFAIKISNISNNNNNINRRINAFPKMFELMSWQRPNDDQSHLNQHNKNPSKQIMDFLNEHRNNTL